jgi:hypothetical protein
VVVIGGCGVVDMSGRKRKKAGLRKEGHFMMYLNLMYRAGQKEKLYAGKGVAMPLWKV